MSLTIPQLKSKWNKEKSAYTTQEVGSGTQSFVKDILLSEELFNLKDGKLTTSKERRENEVIYEYKTEQGRRIDFAIFINPEVIIPVEVERYQNIDIGIKQLLQYQIDLDRKYGILTDGSTWLFYNNNFVLGEFTLDNILDKKSEFWTFWDDYIKPERYYLSFFEAVGQLPIFKEAKLLVEQDRQLFFEDITCLIRKFNDKLQIERYFNGLETKGKKKRAVEITYAYIIQFILYKTLVDNEFSDFRSKFDRITKSIHDALKTNHYKDILGVIGGISNEISKNIYRPFAKEQEIINEKLQTLLYKIENKLNDVAPWLDIFVFIKKYSFSNIHNEIFGYIYENYLKDLYEDEKKGQYFTDPAVVNFMLEQIGWTKDKLQRRYQHDKDSISFMDLACGSGTFPYSAVDKLVKTFDKGNLESAKQIEEIVNNNIFGLDIAEFPLYLAEMNILMRLLPLIITEKYNNPIDKKIKLFLTEDSIAEFIDAGLEGTTIHDIDVAGGQQKLFKPAPFPRKSYIRDEDNLNEMIQSMHPPRRRFDYVISNPPYVGYNECSKQGLRIIKLIQEKKAQMSNIYGVNLNTVPNRIKAYAPKPNLYAFFIALGLKLLKDNGRLCYIIPQTILTAGDLDVLRYHLAKFTTIEKIITFSGKMFIGRGLKQNKPVATSSLIFVVRRKVLDKLDLHKVEIIHYKNPNDEIEKCLQNISAGKKITKKKILQNKLLENVANWNFIKATKILSDLLIEYEKTNESMDIYREYTTSRQRFNDVFIIDGSFNIPNKKILSDTQDQKNDYYYVPVLSLNKFRINVFNYYPRTSEIKIAKGGQGMKVIQTTYKVLWRYANPDKFYYVEGDNVLPRFQQFCIGSNNKSEIVYLLSLLNSALTKIIINTYFRNEQEKDILVGVKAIKEFVRVPKIAEHNQHVKDEVIKRTEEMLGLEEKTLSDLVDFSGIMVQKFDDVTVDGNNLILTKGDEKIKCKIRTNAKLVEKVIQEKYSKGQLKLEKETVALSDLKSLPAIDFDKQKEIKDYINDLVFALYFNARIRNIGLENAKAIKTSCSANKYYKVANQEKA